MWKTIIRFTNTEKEFSIILSNIFGQGDFYDKESFLGRNRIDHNPHGDISFLSNDKG